MNRVQKEQFVEEMKSSLSEADAALFLDYTGLTVNDTNLVRKKFREAGVTYVVVKNTLMARAMEGSNLRRCSELPQRHSDWSGYRR